MKRIGLAALVVLGALIVIGTAVSLFTNPSPATAPVVSPAEQAKRDQFLRDQTTEALGRQTIRAQLRDPRSAQFGESFGRLKHGKRVACGYVNARNAFGGYAGDTPWVMVIEDGTVLIRSGDNAGRFAKVWNRYCTGEPDSEM